jgi:hypothetical protein
MPSPEETIQTQEAKTMSDVSQVEVSVCGGVRDWNLQTYTLETLVHNIRCNTKLKDHCEYLRNEADKEKRQKYKAKHLPAFIPSGVFTTRKRSAPLAEKWVEDSGLVVVDYDGMTMKEAIEMRDNISKLSFVVMAFISPSGGLKVLVRTEDVGRNDDKEHKRRWAYSVVRLEQDFEGQLVADDSGKDPTRLCFMSYDENVHFNPEAECLEIPADWMPAQEEITLSNTGTEITQEIRTDQRVTPTAAEEDGLSMPRVEHLNPRIISYIEKIKSKMYHDGSKGLMPVVRVLLDGFALEDDIAWEYLLLWNENIADPVWSQKELEHAVQNVKNQEPEKERGWLNRESNDGLELLTDYAMPELIAELKAIKAKDLVSTHADLRDPIVDGLFRKGEVCNIIAAPKTGKSILALQLSLAVSNGDQFLGMKTHKAAVMLVDNELHTETLSYRLNRAAQETISNIENLVILSLRGHLCPLDQLRSKIAEEANKHQAGVIILDALYRLLPADISENDNAGMTRLYNELDKLATETGASIIAIHHTSKGGQSGKEITDGGSGAGSISRAADCHIYIREHEVPDAVSIHAVTRSFKAPDPFVARREGFLFTVDESLHPDDMKGRSSWKKQSQSKPPNAEDITPPEIGSPVTKKAFIAEVAEEMRLTKTHAEMGVERAIKLHRIKEFTGPHNAKMIGHPDEEAVGTLAERIKAYFEDDPFEKDFEKVAKEFGCSAKTVERAHKNANIEEPW